MISRPSRRACSRRSLSAFATTKPSSSPLIRRARPEEAARLRELAHRSKAHWPYSAAFLETVRPMLQLGHDEIAAHEVHVLERDGLVLGWHRVTFHGDDAELEDLWLEPALIGKGLGRLLFDHAAELARGHGSRGPAWDAEPSARGFHEA